MNTRLCVVLHDIAPFYTYGWDRVFASVCVGVFAPGGAYGLRCVRDVLQCPDEWAVGTRTRGVQKVAHGRFMCVFEKIKKIIHVPDSLTSDMQSAVRN